MLYYIFIYILLKRELLKRELLKREKNEEYLVAKSMRYDMSKC